ncbi:hypothetical protein LCGC14_2860610 [marine sediment metagenome]|uniref:Uncharacterized protein n=1 Tax=marine sediment metagenome TaxID=412755 RepID=A0A0F9AWV1_9ZZZZ
MSEYEKHSLFVGKYDKSLGQVAFAPKPDAQWVVRRYLGSKNGEGQFTPEIGEAERGPLVLILQDDSFWPVMSFLTEDEAASLAAQLTEAVGYSLSSTTKKLT